MNSLSMGDGCALLRQIVYAIPVKEIGYCGLYPMMIFREKNEKSTAIIQRIEQWLTQHGFQYTNQDTTSRRGGWVHANGSLVVLEDTVVGHYPYVILAANQKKLSLDDVARLHHNRINQKRLQYLEEQGYTQAYSDNTLVQFLQSDNSDHALLIFWNPDKLCYRILPNLHISRASNALQDLPTHLDGFSYFSHTTISHVNPSDSELSFQYAELALIDPDLGSGRK